MRLIEFLTDRLGGDFAAGMNLSSSLVMPPLVKGDTLSMIFTHVEKNRDTPARTLYKETPWPVGISLRASVTLIDAAPESGTFKLEVVDPGGDQATDELTWPGTFSDAAAIAAWKASVLAALKALPNVGNDGVLSSDPADAPGHFLYFTWADPADTREIRVIENGLAPASFGKTKIQKAAPRYQQLIKLIQAPFVTTTALTAETPEQPLVQETQLGGSGSNEIQSIYIPPQSVGGLVLGFNGASAEILAVPGATASQIQNVLNALLPDGATNPGFRVKPLANSTMAVEFIGPLANAPQSALDAEIKATPNATKITGSLNLTSPRFERLLNGQRTADVVFELAIVGAGEGTILRDFKLLNDGTSPEVVEDLEEIGAVIVNEQTVYIDSEAGEPFVEASPGFQFVPVAAGTSFNIAHNLGTRQPSVRVSYKHSTAPEEWHDLTLNGDFVAESTSSSNVLVTFAQALSNVVGHARHFSRFKFFIGSPDASIVIFNHEHTWASVKETLPAGMSVAAKFAAIDAALGVFGGVLNVPASSITGPIPGDKIDLTSLIQRLFESTAFTTTLVEQLKVTITNTEVLNSMLEKLSTLETFQEFLRTELLEIFSSDPSGISTFFRKIPDVTFLIPNSFRVPGPSVKQLIPVASETITTEGGTTTKVTTSKQVEESLPTLVTIYAPLSAMLSGPAAGGNVTGVLTPEHAEAATPGRKCTVGVGGAEAASVQGRGRVKFAQGDFVTFKHGHWYKIVESPAASNKWWPSECELELFRVAIRANQLAQGNRWSIQFVPTLSLEGNVSGEVVIAFEQAAIPNVAEHGVLDWDNFYELSVEVTPAPTSHRLGVTVDRTGPATFAGNFFLYGVPSAFDPAGGDMIFRARITRFDIDPAVTDPRGALAVTLRNATDSITEIPS